MCVLVCSVTELLPDLLTGRAVRGGGEGAPLGSLREERDGQRDGAAGEDPERHQQARGAAAERALRQRAAADRPAPAQAPPVSSAPSVFMFAVLISEHTLAAVFGEKCLPPTM